MVKDANYFRNVYYQSELRYIKNAVEIAVAGGRYSCNVEIKSEEIMPFLLIRGFQVKEIDRDYYRISW